MFLHSADCTANANPMPGSSVKTLWALPMACSVNRWGYTKRSPKPARKVIGIGPTHPITDLPHQKIRVDQQMGCHLQPATPQVRHGRQPRRFCEKAHEIIGGGVESNFGGQGAKPDKMSLFDLVSESVSQDCGMARSIRTEFPRAFYQPPSLLRTQSALQPFLVTRPKRQLRRALTPENRLVAQAK